MAVTLETTTETLAQQQNPRDGITPGTLQVVNREGKIIDFNPSKITVAITKAFLAVQGDSAGLASSVHEIVATLTNEVVDQLHNRYRSGGAVHIEEIQDKVELTLMQHGHHKIARAYVLYREKKRAEREAANQAQHHDGKPALTMVLRNGKKQPLNEKWLLNIINNACAGLDSVDGPAILSESLRNLYDGVPQAEVENALIMATRTKIEREPNYGYVAARLLLNNLKDEVFDFLHLPPTDDLEEFYQLYPESFKRHITKGVELELLDKKLLRFDLEQLAAAIEPKRDLQFNYLGLQTLYDRYFLHWQDTKIELPQAFFMRIAMGLAVNEDDINARAIEFYRLLSSFDYMSSTPTLFNAGTLRPQLSSCYLSTVPDDLAGIYDAIRDNALLSKFAGGLGNDWTSVRSMGAHIKGTNGKSQGVVPFLKVANDTLVAVNQGGKRKGAGCAYLETWHLDIEEFLELRKNTGDDRRRTHDMNTACWIPDLFMQRVIEDKEWTLFSPHETPDLHDIYGPAFEQAYVAYEQKAQAGKIKTFKTISAKNLWRKMISMLFETGHPWITFKDPCNIRSPQQHVGVVHSSNLCTEITLNTSVDEIAVCNLGSVNLPNHITADGLDTAKLERTVTTAIRMLDNVIDINYYSVPQARRSNLRHRPIGMGMMGFQDALLKLKLAYASDAAVEFADKSTEAVSYFAIKASSNLAKERGAYDSFEGSLWSQGVLPIDSLKQLQQIRGHYIDVNTDTTLDWDSLRSTVKTNGMRNSNVLAIAPTATIANICGVSASIEPIYQNLYVKSNLSGEFTIVNPYLVAELKELEIWDEAMVDDLKYYNGSLAAIERIPDELKARYATAFEMSPLWLVEAGSRRQKWLDQAQSLNIYIGQPSGKLMDNLYKTAWMKGLKTTYYCRSMGATNAERSTIKDSALNAVQPTDIECEACQ